MVVARFGFAKLSFDVSFSGPTFRRSPAVSFQVNSIIVIEDDAFLLQQRSLQFIPIAVRKRDLPLDVDHAVPREFVFV